MKRSVGPLRQVLRFSGRARRREFWTFAALHFLLLCVMMGVDLWRVGFFSQDVDLDRTPGSGAWSLWNAYYLVTLPIAFAVATRRLHDSGRTGWWVWLVAGPQAVGVLLSALLWLTYEPGSELPGWWTPAVLVLGWAFVLGLVLLLAMTCLSGTVGPNRYGPDPRGRAAASKPDEVWGDLR